VTCATIASCDDFEDIVEWGEQHLGFLRRFGEFHHGVPCARWLRDLVNRVDPVLFGRCFESWVAALWPDRHEFIAIDGKTARRTHDRRKGLKALHTLSAYATKARLTLAQLSVPQKSNEITAIPDLLDELAEHPDDIHLHLELVTLYYSRRDVERFEAAAEAMHAHITDPQQDEWQDVVHMGEDLAPGHPLFDQNAASPAHEETEAHHDFDIDDYAADNHASTAVSSMPPLPPQVPKKVSGYNFNFDLTPAHAAAEPVSDMAAVPPLLVDTQHEATPATHAESASSWHFDDAENDHQLGSKEHDMGEFNDDPVDTKLDLARAYLDMGDSDGARAMLGEVLKEGSQMQQDVAKRLLETLH